MYVNVAVLFRENQCGKLFVDLCKFRFFVLHF